MKTIILMMICSIIYLVTMDVVNKKVESLDFTMESKLETNDSNLYQVSISGGVNNPGTYSVNKGDTLGYLVTLAGGLKDNADASTYNLSAILKNNGAYYIGLMNNDKTEKVSINKANLALLDTLPGIGSVLAKRIVSYRSSNGEFSSLEDIKNVDGIGDALFNQIKDLICL
jgi:competence protein ComEA